MVTTRNDSALVDTNILLSATDESRQKHAASRALLEQDDRTLGVTSQIVREYLSVATRPTEANGLGLSGADAVANVHVLLDRLDLVPEPMSAIESTINFVRNGTVAGKQVHDAHVVSVALAHGIPAVVTADDGDFARFSGLIAVESVG